MPAGTEVDDDKTAQDQAAADSDYHRTDEQVTFIILFLYVYILLFVIFFTKVNIGLECVASHLKSLKKKFLRVSSQATITHLKKFIAVKVLDGSDKYRDVSNNINVLRMPF